MVATVCRHQGGPPAERRQQLTGNMPSLRSQSNTARSNLPKLYYRSRIEDRSKSLDNKGSFYKRCSEGNPGEVPGLRRYDSAMRKLATDSKTTRQLSRKLEVRDEPMPRWLPELLRNQTPPFSKDFPTNLLLSRSRFWPSQPPKPSFFYGKGLKWPKVKHMVVKHPKLIESCPNVNETLWNLKPAVRLRSRMGRGRLKCDT